ncbi:hypothetical protein COCC4DRAFT_192843 [Bipolaris maydis ATCC 48331]|uniref:Uncharacterized protein n=2 Tax=Cochliobolus heterostrophus TaxID=5016 RepID=M2UHT0_COCH5|nr:uncharacterized protein COCC4DRAFT_192843 [Bipolaris maydis ATCC 48331]EMD87553.1 hypothetical protein COCHEDRAFT_1206751 [Bipolaris maydis C5]ENI06754.1 hypothetical protein COCC4DRAFT_192843 [Bipolaris maydis ATCC 48331]
MGRLTRYGRSLADFLNGIIPAAILGFICQFYTENNTPVPSLHYLHFPTATGQLKPTWENPGGDKHALIRAALYPDETVAISPFAAVQPSHVSVTMICVAATAATTAMVHGHETFLPANRPSLPHFLLSKALSTRRRHVTFSASSDGAEEYDI